MVWIKLPLTIIIIPFEVGNYAILNGFSTLNWFPPLIMFGSYWAFLTIACHSPEKTLTHSFGMEVK